MTTMTPPETPITGPIETIAKGPRQGSYVALAAAVAGSVLAIVGFYAGIPAALSGGGSGAGLTLVLMFVGLVLDVVGVILAIVMLVRGAPKLVPWVAIVAAFAPVILLAVLAIYVRL
jgi:hypothetical protein